MIIENLRKALGFVVARRRVARKTRPMPPMPISHVSVVKLDGIGDFILSTVFLRILAERLPHVNVHLFCRKPVGMIARRQFPLWQVTELPARTKPFANIFSELWLRGRLGRLKPSDILIDLRGYRDMSDSAVSSWIPSSYKIAFANCFPKNWRWGVMPREDLIYDCLFALPTVTAKGIPEEISNYRALASELFPDSKEARVALPVLRADGRDIAEVVSILANQLGVDVARPFLLVAPTSAVATKQYPVELLAVAIRSVLAECAMPTLITGLAEDAPVIARLLECLRGQKGVFPVAGRLDLSQHVALVSLAAATLSMDSSTAHIAGALGVPAVALLGGGHYGQFAPWGESNLFYWLTNRLPCFGCRWQCIYDRPLCIHDISPDEVARSLIRLLKLSAYDRLNSQMNVKQNIPKP